MFYISIYIFLALIVFGSGYEEQPKIDYQEIRCLVCEAVVDEMDKMIEKVNPNRKVDVGNYRLDAYGNKKQKTVPYARSELHLTEVMENVCNKMDDYVRAHRKEDKSLMLLKLLTGDGQMNPLMSEVDIVQDSDLNKSLKFYCEGIVEEFEEPILKLYANHEENMKSRLCADSAQLCPEDSEDSFEEDWDDERDEL